MSCASAHEFWLLPARFQVAPGDPVSLSMLVGENFAGARVVLLRQYIEQLQRRAGGETADLMAWVPQAGTPGTMQVPLARKGTQVVFADTEPSHIELSADRFHAYLHDEGLDFIKAAREAAGTAASPGRERFRRHLKTIVSVGAPGGGDALRRTGQRLEIVPLADPAATPAGRDLAFQVWFEDKPLAGALVKLWHRREGQTLIVRAATDAQGCVLVTPPWPGVWMVSVVHMVPAQDAPGTDWDSYWGNLTFELPARAQAVPAFTLSRHACNKGSV